MKNQSMEKIRAKKKKMKMFIGNRI